MAKRVLLADSLESVAREALDGVSRLLRPWRTSVGFLDRENQLFTIYKAHGSGRSAWQPGVSVPLSEFGADMRQLERGRPDLAPDLSIDDGRRPKGRLSTTPLASQMIVPVFNERELVGTLNVGWDRTHAFDEVDVEVATELAELIGLGFGQVLARAELDADRKDAESRSKTKSSFLANMTHEIRTPLNAIIGASGLMLDMPLPEEANQLAQTVRAGGEQLLRVVSNILDLSKLEAGGIELEEHPLRLRPLIDSVVRLVKCNAEQTGASLTVQLDELDHDAWIGDETRIRQVLANLLSNAVKFTPGGRVWLSCATTRDDLGHRSGVVFDVIDSGIGIPRDRAQSVFESFSQAGRDKRKDAQGSGLGLPISRQLARAMGGDVSLVDSEGGCHFRFSVHMREDRSPVPEAVSSADASWSTLKRADIQSGKLRILIAEDNVVNQQVLVQMLTKMGCRADVVSDGTEAVTAVAERHYDLVFMDVQMPLMSGVEACREIRSRPRASSQRPLSIVALTAAALAEQREACLEAGMDAFLTKPVRADELRRVIESVGERLAT